MTKKKLIIGISASPRAKLPSEDYAKVLGRIGDYQKMYEVIYELADDKKISNTEGLILASLFGTRSHKTEVDGVNLRDVFQNGRMSERELLEKVERASGIIVGSPVYFGDRSSWWDLLMGLIKSGNVDVKGKIFGAVSVGAKRNGGQETTLIFGLLDALNLGFNVVGNGPPSSQFGGTGWAGDLGKIQDDNFGLDTSMGLGNRVGRYVEIMSHKSAAYGDMTIGVLHSGFGEDRKEIEKMAAAIGKKGARVLEMNIDELKIRPCLGCSVCPRVKGLEYGCNIKDDMKKMREISSSVDGIIFMHRTGGKERGQYQAFLERTRFIRRDDFLLSDLPFGAYCLDDGFAGYQYVTRMFTAFLRHNMYIMSPLVQVISKGESTVRTSEPDMLCERLLEMAARSKAARAVDKKEYVYQAIGYGDHGEAK